ncbi:hypothetical protein lerEdw1_011234 [Lerista edwardsae]|nr:hypothetical protein lerEdw1_011234 [Lerista edwardsae]
MDVVGLHKNLLPSLFFLFFLFQLSSMMCQFSVVESKSATFPTEKPRHLLDDSVLEPHSPVRNHTLSSVFTNGISIGSSESSEFSEEPSSGLESYLHNKKELTYKFANRGRLYATLGPNWRVPIRNSPRSRSCVYSPTGACSCTSGNSIGVVTMEGPLRRKTLLKEGRKPTLSSWTRYWVTLSGSTLIYFGAKSLRGTERKHYKSTPGKKVSVVGWMVALPDDPEHPDIFQLNNPDKGRYFEPDFLQNVLGRTLALVSLCASGSPSHTPAETHITSPQPFAPNRLLQLVKSGGTKTEITIRGHRTFTFWLRFVFRDPRKLLASGGCELLLFPLAGNVYKFQTGSRFHAILWHKHLDDACRSNRPQVPANLMSFE